MLRVYLLFDFDLKFIGSSRRRSRQGVETGGGMRKLKTKEIRTLQRSGMEESVLLENRDGSKVTEDVIKSFISTS